MHLDDAPKQSVARSPKTDALSGQHRLAFGPPGTHVVFCVGDLVVKLFAPLWPGDFVSEQLVLRALVGRSDFPVPIPRLVAEGEIEGWPYLVMTAVEGVPLYKVWGEMEAADRECVAARCGELMAALHAVPGGHRRRLAHLRRGTAAGLPGWHRRSWPG